MTAEQQSVACKRVWLALINLMFADAVTREAGHEAAIRRDIARTWLTKSSPDFSLACALAGLEPDRVRTKAIAIIERNEPLPRPRRDHARNGPRKKRSPGVVANIPDANPDRRHPLTQDLA